MAWALTLCFLATSGTDILSASRRIATICSSVKRLFFIGSSLVDGSHSLKLRSVLRTWAGHGIKASLVIAGSGPEESALPAHADKLGVAPDVRFIGPIFGERTIG